MTNTTTTVNVQANIANFIERLNAKFPDCFFAAMPGRKNVRITAQNIYNGKTDELSKRAYCFIRLEDGAVLKCDGWKSPAKGVRAWLDQVLANDLQQVDQYTGWLYN
jgi:hypothetical protein